MSNENSLKRRHCEIDTDIEEDTTSIEKFRLQEDEESELPEKSNSVLSSLDENNKKKSVVWDHFEKFVDNKGIM
jgi:hypothetical protein